MKKLVSMLLSLCMLMTMAVCSVSAEVAVPEIKDGTVIEFEKYAGSENKNYFAFTSDTEGMPSVPYGKAVASDHLVDGVGLSGGAVLSIGERIGATGMTFTIPVSVAEPGWYDVELIGSTGTGTYLSYYTMSMGDNNAIAATSGSGTVIYKPEQGIVQGDGIDIYYYPIQTQSGKFLLTENMDSIVITATPNTNTQTGTGIKMVLDCVKFTKVEIPIANRNEETVIEMEDFIPQIRYTRTDGTKTYAANVKEALASGGAVMDMSEKSNLSDIAFDIPVTIAEDGWYHVNLVANNSNKGDTSVLYIKDGEDEWVNNWGSSGYAGKTKLYFGTENYYKYYGVYDHSHIKYLKAGSYKLVASATSITNQTNRVKFVADCLKISAFKTDIPEAGKRIEFEDYQKYQRPHTTGKATNEETGETFLTTLGDTSVYLQIMLNVKKSGYYTVNYHGSPWKNNGLSKTNFYLNDAETPFLDNDNAKHGVNEGYLFSKYLDAYMFTNEAVYLEAGTHKLFMEVIERDPDPAKKNQVAYAADYIEFIPVSTAALNAAEKTVAVNAYYSEALTGKVIFAAYCGKELVGMTEADAADESALSDTVSYTGTTAPDTVKVLVWEDLTNIEPVVKAKVLAVK